MKIKKGDTVTVIAGKDRGTTGTVMRALPASDQVVVEGVNVRKRHQRARRGGQAGEIIEVAAPIHVSNVSLVDSSTGTATRVGVERDESGNRVRVAKKSGTKLDT